MKECYINKSSDCLINDLKECGAFSDSDFEKWLQHWAEECESGRVISEAERNCAQCFANHTNSRTGGFKSLGKGRFSVGDFVLYSRMPAK